MNVTLIRGALLSAVVGSSIAIGQPPLNPPANGPRHADPTWHFLSNATVHPKPGEVLEHASVLVRDGKIEAVLPHAEADKPAEAPAGAKVWDFTGLHTYPDYIAPSVRAQARGTSTLRLVLRNVTYSSGASAAGASAAGSGAWRTRSAGPKRSATQRKRNGPPVSTT